MSQNNPIGPVAMSEPSLLKQEKKVLQTKLSKVRRIRHFEDLSSRNEENPASFITSSPVVAATAAAAILGLSFFGIWLAVPAAVITWYALPYRRWVDVAYSSIEKYQPHDEPLFLGFKQELAQLAETGQGIEHEEWNLIRRWALAESVGVSRRITEINDRLEALSPRLQFFGIRKSESKARLIDSVSNQKQPHQQHIENPKPPEKHTPKIKLLFPTIGNDKKQDRD